MSDAENKTGNAGNSKQNTADKAADRNTKAKNKSGGSKVFLTVLMVALVVAISMAGAFAYLIHTNYYGIADKYRDKFENIPIVKLILPPPYDPESPYVMPFHILASKYNETRQKKSELDAEISKLNAIIDELTPYKNNADTIAAQNEAMNKQLTAGLEQYELKVKQYEQIKSELDKNIANINIEEFRKFYESINVQNAKKIYEEIIMRDVSDARFRELASIYESMDAATAAGILQKMGTSKMHLITEILFNMNKDRSSAIVSAMKQDFAAKVMEQLAKLYKK